MFRWIIFLCLFLATFDDLESRLNSPGGRIVGGYDTDISQVPYQVSVKYKGIHCCGGSIIGASYILTAAHCVVGKNQTRFAIRAGSSYHNSGGQLRKVDTIIVHSGFDKRTKNYDAAILVLRMPLTAAEGVGVATLAHLEPQVGDMALISGWGSLKENETRSLFLQAASVPVVSKTVCKKWYKGKIHVTDQTFCAGFYEGGIDACNGDSGGPAMVNGKLAGIVSQGDGCARPKSPTVYTNVASILTWIAENTKL